MIPIERGPYPPEITRASNIDLSGKVAVVTGSSRGIGREIALTLASHKANVVLNSTTNSLPQAEQVKSEIEGMRQKAIIVFGDVSKEQTA
ncbi:MAG: SDR family NAD(P)-dependent oxidoreductase, partial [Candidatus Levybacteria bacterium]|nr:SDR family NAD(P)-dependent oxidoreductase [Candidatus Levybacteria bacterium]